MDILAIVHQVPVGCNAIDCAPSLIGRQYPIRAELIAEYKDPANPYPAGSVEGGLLLHHVTGVSPSSSNRHGSGPPL